MTTPKTMLSDESQQQIEQLAREQQREPGEVLEEAVRRYAAACRLERFADKMGQRARDKGAWLAYRKYLPTDVSDHLKT
jgi:predicted transcriptional regulator